MEGEKERESIIKEEKKLPSFKNWLEIALPQLTGEKVNHIPGFRREVLWGLFFPLPHQKMFNKLTSL